LFKQLFDHLIASSKLITIRGSNSEYLLLANQTGAQIFDIESGRSWWHRMQPNASDHSVWISSSEERTIYGTQDGIISKFGFNGSFSNGPIKVHSETNFGTMCLAGQNQVVFKPICATKVTWQIKK